VKLEADLKARFTRELKAQRPTWLSLLQSTAGAPDRAIVGDGHTSWLEFKHATPSFRSPGIQERLCQRLATTGRCWYVIWAESALGADRRTLIVSPAQVRLLPQRASGLKSVKDLVIYESCLGYDMPWLVTTFARLHMTSHITF